MGSIIPLDSTSVMGVGIWSGYSNGIDLLGQKAEILLSVAETCPSPKNPA